MHGMNDLRSAPPIGADLDAEPEDEFLQRRWFAALSATRRLKTECRERLNALRHAEQAWRHASWQLAQFEHLTETLEQQLTCRNEAPGRRLEPLQQPEVSAA
jgi:hypothetical protein